jgi:MFS family permease
MFLLPSLIVGIVFALLLGGRPSQLVRVEFRHAGAVFLALGIQIALFSPLGAAVPAGFVTPIHVGTYGLLFLFAAANVRMLALLPFSLGMALNAAAIVANGGHMPVSPSAWQAAGLTGGERANIRLGAEHLGFLGDIFAIPSTFPLANVFSIGDLLIAAGMVGLIIAVSLRHVDDRPLVPTRLIRPFAVVPFRRLAAGKLVSHCGDWLTLTALVGWVYEETHSTASVALLLLIRLAPPIVGGGLAAAVVDRLRKERVLVTIEILRGLTIAGALVAVVSDVHSLAFAAVAVSGVLAAISAATVPALVPFVLDNERLPAGNAALGLAQDAAMALGALAGGIALTASSVIVALTVDVGTFVVAAVLYLGVRPRQGAAVEVGEKRSGKEPGGVRYILSRPILLAVIGAFAVATTATGLTNAILPRFLDDLGLGAGGYGFGLAALACGLAAGQGVVGFSRVGSTAGRWIGVGLMLMAALFMTLAFTEHAPTALLVLGLIGLVDGTTDVLFNTIVQRESDPRYYGRVFGFGSAFFTTTMLGAVAAAPLVERIAPPQEAILVAGLTLLIASTIAILGTRARRERTDVVADGAPAGRGPAPPLAEPGRRAPIRLVPGVPALHQMPALPGGDGRGFRVVVRLSDATCVAVAGFDRRADAGECARDVSRYLATLPADEWPELGGRLLRPDAIVSVDVLEEASASWRDGDREEGFDETHGRPYDPPSEAAQARARG